MSASRDAAVSDAGEAHALKPWRSAARAVPGSIAAVEHGGDRGLGKLRAGGVDQRLEPERARRSRRRRAALASVTGASSARAAARAARACASEWMMIRLPLTPARLSRACRPRRRPRPCGSRSPIRCRTRTGRGTKRLVEHLGLGHVEGRAVRVVVEVDRHGRRLVDRRGCP